MNRMSNKTLKLKLHKEHPFCYYCGCLTTLTHIKNIPSGESLPPNSATIEHLISRFEPTRWKQKKNGTRRKVLACYKCNQQRSILETLCLSRVEVLKRSRGYSLNPRGRPKITTPLPTIQEVKKVLNETLD
jgi:hypothetical protein